MSTANDPWGRVDDDGTVYVRTAEGERVIGSWQAGSPDEALAFYRRKFEALDTEVTLLEQRVTTTDLSPAQARAGIERLRAAVTDAHAVGDLGQLQARLEALSGKVDHRQEEVRAARDHARAEARDIKERIVAEAEHIAAAATHWKNSGERLRQLLEEWKTAPRADRAVEAALWKRLSAARNAFNKRRKAYFADLEEERGTARSRKEKLVVEAEGLATSTDWTATAAAFRELMRQWKAAGRAARPDEDALWTRFKTAQDTFFAARAEVFSAKDAALREHAAVKSQLLEEAGKALPGTARRARRGGPAGVPGRREPPGRGPPRGAGKHHDRRVKGRAGVGGAARVPPREPAAPRARRPPGRRATCPRARRRSPAPAGARARRRGFASG